MGVVDQAELDAVRTDGGLIHLRPVRESDRDALQDLNKRASDRSIYLRFFSLSRYAADSYLDTLLRPASADHQALAACLGDEIVGVAAFERVPPVSAEVALLVDDADQHAGIGTLLLEHLASIARHQGIRHFVAEILSENAGMIKVLRDLGYPFTSDEDHGVLEIVFDLEAGPQVVNAIDERERVADVASLRPVLAPRSVAVVGASDRPRSVGHEVLRNILDGGFTGTVHVVNPHHDVVLGVPSVASAAELPAAPDLAIVAVPAAAVADVVRACGKRGARGVLLLSSGFGEVGTAGKAQQDEVLAIARRYGMRLVGPNCLGVLNTDPSVRLNATFAPLPMQPGGLGLVSQSGALGIAVLEAAERCGMGISQFVSVGNKADISSNDLLLEWERDERTSVIALYVESFGNPGKFARIARRVSRRKPIIAIKAGRSPAGKRAGQSHTAAAASSDVVVDALFTQAGVLRVNTMAQMLDVARVLTGQPLLRGPRVAVFGNAGGPEILAADAAVAAGLTVAPLDDATAELIRRAVPTAASCQNPIDLGAGVQPAPVGEALRIVLASAEIDAVLVVLTETLVAAPAEVLDAVASAAADGGKPVVVTQVGGEPRSLPPTGTQPGLPVFEFPEPAAAALGLAWRYAGIRSAPADEAVRPDGIDLDGARALVSGLLPAQPQWLGPQDAVRLLDRYGIPMCPQRIVADADAAAHAANEVGYPVAVKITGAVHKSDVGGVQLGVVDEAGVRKAFDAVRVASPKGTPVLIQPMIPAGFELIVGAVADPQFGPVVMVGAGGVLADLLADRTFRLTPLASSDAEQMINRLRIAPVLDGYRGSPAVSRAAVYDLLQRVSALAEDLPELAELDLNPVVCRGEELVVVDAKVRLAPARTTPDAELRQLRGPSGG